MDKKKLVIEIDADFHRKLKITSTAQGQSIREFVINAVLGYMEQLSYEKRQDAIIKSLEAQNDKQ